jgi:hypothetical protein
MNDPVVIPGTSMVGMNNERRADIGGLAVITAADMTGVSSAEPAATAVIDVLAYIAHFCDRLGLNPEETFSAGIRSYTGDFEDGPAAEARLDPAEKLRAMDTIAFAAGYVAEPAFESKVEASEQFSDGGPATPENARLIVLNMALNGTPRQEAERYVERSFELDPDEAAKMIDENYKRVGG